MSTTVILDAAPLGLLCHPRNPPVASSCPHWFGKLHAAGVEFVIPEIADYELRRELLRINSQTSIVSLNTLVMRLRYLPLTTTDMRKAAELWAWARQAGIPTASDPALDADVILSAQALNMNQNVVIATSNPAHLSRFVHAMQWSVIRP